MALRVAINGFGRIGRCVYRSAFGQTEFEIVHINDLTAASQLGHLLAHDSVHGRWSVPVNWTDTSLTTGDRTVAVSAEKDPAKLPWKDLGVDVVLECTGLFTKREKVQAHLDAGARRVIISAPAEGEDLTLCMGVNDHQLDLAKHRIISNASCTTNCLAPVAKVLHENFGIVNGLMTTVHSYTMDQNLLDAPHKKGDMRRARAAALSMVPTSTGAAKAVALVLPELKGKLHGLAVRVPTPNVSLVDVVVNTEKPVSKQAINDALTAAANGPLKGILQAVNAPIVSYDINGNPHSSIADLELTSVMGDRMAKVLSWYDNEWGFSNRMVDLCTKIAKG
jgi:glyceraldehyde 3-phosphate dehydrogenase